MYDLIVLYQVTTSDDLLRSGCIEWSRPIITLGQHQERSMRPQHVKSAHPWERRDRLRLHRFEFVDHVADHIETALPEGRIGHINTRLA